METQLLKKRVRSLLWFFVFALVLSGVTAFPLKWEIATLQRLFGPGTFVEELWPAMADWISLVHRGITETDQRYPFMAYGTDWLAFAHIVVAIAFWGPIKDPVKNIWVVECGMIACALVIPLAMIWGPIRGIPFFWRLIDSAFGIVGIIPLWVARDAIRRIEDIEQTLRHTDLLGGEEFTGSPS